MNEAGTTSVPRLLTVGEFAAGVRVSPATVRRWARTGRIQSTRPGGKRTRTLRIPETELTRLFAELDDDASGAA